MNNLFAQVMFKRVILVAFTAVLSVSGIGINSMVWAETLEERKTRLQQEAEIAELEKRISEAKKATAKAKRDAVEQSLPDFTGRTPPEGSINIDNLQFENTLLAYQAMEVVAGKIQTELTKKLGPNISLVLLDNKEIVSDAFAKLAYKSFEDQVVTIQNRYYSQNPNLKINRESPGITATADFILDILPFFRADKTFKGTSFTINNQAFVAQLASKFRDAGDSKVSVYYPAQYPLIRQDAVKDILTSIDTLQRLKRQGEERIAELTNDDNDSEKIEKSKLEALNQSVEDLITKLKKVDDETNKSLFEVIARYRTLELIRGENNKIYFMFVNITGGGTSRTTRTFLSNRLRHSGGIIVEYIIYDNDMASILLSNILDSYTGFTKIPNSK